MPPRWKETVPIGPHDTKSQEQVTQKSTDGEEESELDDPDKTIDQLEGRVGVIQENESERNKEQK